MGVNWQFLATAKVVYGWWIVPNTARLRVLAGLVGSVVGETARALKLPSRRVP